MFVLILLSNELQEQLYPFSKRELNLQKYKRKTFYMLKTLRKTLKRMCLCRTNKIRDFNPGVSDIACDSVIF